MSSVKIEIADLRGKYGDEVKKLSEFLEEKLKTKVNVYDREITINPTAKGEVASKDYLRVLLRKFLHKEELKEEFRVIAGKENSLVIKERRVIEIE